METALFNNIAFIGGIHGVGKSTVCKSICTDTGLIHLTASDVLKWNELKLDNIAKNVVDIKYNQDRLINGLTAIVSEPNKYLLDGHYCLLGKEDIITKVPLETFIQLNPFSLNIIIDDIFLIKERLEVRDNRPYNSDLLNKMQENEIAYAKEISDILNVKLNICTSNDFSDITNLLKQQIL